MASRFKFLITIIAVILPLSLSGVSATHESVPRAEISQHQNLINPESFVVRQEFVDSFERESLAPWTTYGLPGSVVLRLFGIRDTTNVYGPQAPANSGFRYAGHPPNDIARYPSPGQNPGNATCLESPTIDLAGWDSCYVSFAYWADFEGNATNFDGFILQVSSNNGSTWIQVDADHLGHLIPSYDSPLAGTGLLGYAWAYCYDTRPNWVVVATLDLIDLGYVAPGDQMKIRFIFAYDALDGGEGCFLDDVRIASTPPTDLQPPVIEHMPLIDTPDTVNNYTITATITDPFSGVNPDSVAVHYLIEGGSWTSARMIHVSGDVYEGEIPAQSYHTDIWYYIRAVDNVGNVAQSLTYSFEVTNAITIAYDDNQPYWIPGGLNIGDGLFVQFNFSSVGLDSGLLHQVKYYFSSGGYFHLRVYRINGSQPGQLVYSRNNLQSAGYMWHTEDITDANVRMSTDPVIGYIIGPPIGSDTASCLMDPYLNYQNNMWAYVNSAWGHPTSGGDYMIRLKVIPLPIYAIKERSISYPITNIQLFPNPIGKDGGFLQYQLPQAQHVRVTVFDIAGKVVKILEDGYKDAGTYRVHWDGNDDKNEIVASGIYFFILDSDNQTITKKVLFIK